MWRQIPAISEDDDCFQVIIRMMCVPFCGAGQAGNCRENGEKLEKGKIYERHVALAMYKQNFRTRFVS